MVRTVGILSSTNVPAAMARVLLAVCAVVTLAGACSGGDGSDRSAPTSAPSTSAPSSTEPATPATTVPPQLTLHGLGPVQVGMTVAEASAALGLPLRPVTPGTDSCTMYAPSNGLDGVSFLVTSGKVARVDVTSGSIRTAEGLALGQTEAEAQDHYQHHLVVSDHDFLLGGHYLTLVPADRADAGFRLVAESDGRRITAIRAGRMPEVELTEGCA